MKIGFIGLGIMGESMCANIIKKHNDNVFVFDFVEEQVAQLVKAGGIKCESSVELAKNVNVTLNKSPSK